MQCTRSTATHNLLTKQSAASVLKALNGATHVHSASRTAFIVIQHHNGNSRRQFSTTNQRQFSNSRHMLMKDFFPVKESEQIRRTPPAWHHPVYTEEQMNSVVVAHREARNFSDRVALGMVRVARWGLDLATGYRHGKAVKLAETDPALAAKKYGMTEHKYMIRNIFLESVAGKL